MSSGRKTEQSGTVGLCWVPRAALTYLAHTEGGASIRALARRQGCHASTISRQVRAFEARRDDFLVDHALRRLGGHVTVKVASGSCIKERRMTIHPLSKDTEPTLTQDRLNREARRILRRMCETGAMLAVASEMDKAVVVRDTAAGQNRTAVVDRDIAEAMALKAWIHCDAPGRISRYRITQAGRTALGELVAEAENKASREKGSSSDIPDQDSAPLDFTPRRQQRYGPAESPLILLSRRRARDGSRFLPAPLVRAGERLREDFEIGRLGEIPRADWPAILSGAETPGPLTGDKPSAQDARDRVLTALRDLGPGLGDVALRCCCFLEGLETAEKKMGWSARSGKIVLRIALQRVNRFYDQQGDSAGLMG